MRDVAQHRLFICYSRADSEWVLSRLDWFRAAGFEPWVDDEKITGGSVWRDAISDAIEGAGALIYFVSPRSIQSDRCGEEVDFALELEVPVLTVYVEETQLPNRLLFRLAHRQAIQAYRLSEERCRQTLLDAVHDALDGRETGADYAPVVATTPQTVRLVVLPFQNLTGDAEREYFCDGLTAETIGHLGRQHQKRLRVIARSSSMVYKNVSKAIGEIGAELGVDYVLEGSIRHEGNRVRVSVSLARVSDQMQVWSDVYDRELASAFDVQNDIADGVAETLQIAVPSEAKPATAEAASVNSAAREAFLKGRFHWYRQDFVIAKDYFEQAIRLNPNYAPAYIGLADAVATPGHIGQVPARDVMPEARRLYAKALALDEGLADAHDMKARIAFAYDWDPADAEHGFRRAIELNPNYPDAHVIYSQLLGITGRREAALAEAQRGLDIDPNNIFFQSMLALSLTGVGRHDEAIELLEGLPPGYPLAHELLWGACYRTERYDQAVRHATAFFGEDEEVTEVLSRYGKEESSGPASYFDAMRNAAEVLVGRSNGADVSPTSIACLYAHAEEFDQAVTWLHKAVEIQDSYVVYAALFPEYHKLWNQDGFRAVMRKINLER